MSGRVHVRVDNRLLHGQVVQYWLGHLEITHLIVADDGVARNEAMSIIYRMALPDTVQLTIIPLGDLPAMLKELDSVGTMVLIKDVQAAVRSVARGATISAVTLGNVHAAADRARITDAIYLSAEEVDALASLCRQGIVVEIQTFPGEVMRLGLNEDGGTRWLRS